MKQQVGEGADGLVVVAVTDASFDDDVLRADRPIIVDFWAEWCMPCRLVAPVLEEIAEKQAGRLIVAKLNVDENPVTADAYQVQSIALMGVFSAGELVKWIPRSAAEGSHHGRARGVPPMTPDLDPAGRLAPLHVVHPRVTGMPGSGTPAGRLHESIIDVEDLERAARNLLRRCDGVQ